MKTYSLLPIVLEDLLGRHAWETCWEELPGVLGRLAWETCLEALYTWRTCFSHWGQIEYTHVFKHLPSLRIYQNPTPTLTSESFASFTKPGPIARGLVRSGEVNTRPTVIQRSHPWIPSDWWWWIVIPLPALKLHSIRSSLIAIVVNSSRDSARMPI